jgi:hypothetical protein
MNAKNKENSGNGLMAYAVPEKRIEGAGRCLQDSAKTHRLPESTVIEIK